MALDKVGALWLKDGKKGKFMGGEIKLNDNEPAVRVLVFKNKHHEDGDRKPDYEVFVSADDEREEAPRREAPTQVVNGWTVSDDDVPF